jgi:hypothetical protein
MTKPMPPLESPLRSLWRPGAEPADPFVRWLEQKLASRRCGAREQRELPCEPPPAPVGEVEVAPVGR